MRPTLFSPLSPFHWPQNTWPWITLCDHFMLFYDFRLVWSEAWLSELGYRRKSNRNERHRTVSLHGFLVLSIENELCAQQHLCLRPSDVRPVFNALSRLQNTVDLGRRRLWRKRNRGRGRPTRWTVVLFPIYATVWAFDLLLWAFVHVGVCPMGFCLHPKRHRGDKLPRNWIRFLCEVFVSLRPRKSSAVTHIMRSLPFYT